MTSVAYGALWIFIFSLPWENVISGGGVAFGSRLTGALALGIAVLAVTITGRFRRLHPFHVAALLFVIWAMLEIAIFSHSAKLPNKLFTYIQLCLVLWMIWELAPSWGRQVGLLTAYVLGAYVAAFNTFLVYHREAGALRRFTAAGTDPNDLAMTLALAVPMAWYLGMAHHRTLLRWICRGYLPVGVVAIGLTGSRGGLITTVVALLIVPLMIGKLTPGRLVTAVVILAASAGIAAAYIPHTIVERLSTTRAEVGEGGDLGNRLRIWKAGFNAFVQEPLKGHGTGGFVHAITPELGVHSKVAHNSYLSVLVEQGIVGLILYLTMFAAVYRSVLRLPRLERRFALTLLATLLIAILPLTWEDRKPVWFVLAALLGLSQAWVSGLGIVPAAPPRAAPVPGPRAAPRRLKPLTTPSTDRDALA